jgi:pimeloyl-ACP methyl ester carboxylesterase
VSSGKVGANGITLAYESFGPDDAPVILLIMGLGAQLVLWPDAMVEALVARGFRIVRFDNRDIGLSTHLSDRKPPNPLLLMAASALRLPVSVPYKLADMAADSIALMDALRIGRAHVVGASMGGMIAQLVAARYPNRVQTLTSIMSTSGARGLPGPAPELRKVLLRRPFKGSREQLIELGTDVFEAIGSDGVPREERRAIVARAFDRSYDPAGVRRQLAAIVASGSRAADLPRIKAPTLVIHGSADRLVPPEGGADTARRVPGALLEMIEGMAHDLPRRYLPRIVDLIAEHARRA